MLHPSQSLANRAKQALEALIGLQGLDFFAILRARIPSPLVVPHGG